MPATGDSGRKHSSVVTTKAAKSNTAVPTLASHSHLAVSPSQGNSSSSASASASSTHRPVSPRTPSLTRESLSANSTPRQRRHSHSDRPERSQLSSPSSDAATHPPPAHHTRQPSLSASHASDRPARARQAGSTGGAAVSTRSRNSSGASSSAAPTPGGARRTGQQAWSGALKGTRPASRSLESERRNDRSSDGSGSGEHVDEELDMLLDALLPRLVQRMQHALEHIRHSAPSSLHSSSSSHPSVSSSSASLASADNTATDVDNLVQRGVTDTLQRLFSQLLHPTRAHDSDDASDAHSHATSAAADGDASGEYVEPPSMALLGDMSYHAGSKVHAGQQLMKVWSVKNTGDTQWPEQVRLLPASSASAAQYSLESDIILFTDLLPGDTMNVSVLITTPTTAGRHAAHYQLAFHQPAEKQWVRFGDELIIDLVCQQPHTSSSSSTAASSAASSASSTAALSTAAADRSSAVENQPNAASMEVAEESKQSADERNSSGESSASPLDTSTVSELQPAQTQRRPLSRVSSGDAMAAEEDRARRKERKKDKLRVERGKDRSQSVDSKPPVLSTNDWWGLVSVEAVRPPAGACGSSQSQVAAANTSSRAVLQSPSHLLSFDTGAGGDSGQDGDALDWLKHASGILAVPTSTSTSTSTPPTASTTISATAAPPGMRVLTDAATGQQHLTSKSANHSRSNSPALPPTAFSAAPAPMFARSNSQSFPPAAAAASANGGGELMSPPLTPPVPAGSLLSKDDLMSWAGGQGLMTTNKQTGVQSATHTQSQQQQQQPQQPQFSPPASSSVSAATAGQGAAAPTPLSASLSSLSNTYGTLPRQPNATLSPQHSSRSRHSMPPAARLAMTSSSSAFNLSTQQQQQQGGGGGSGGGGVGGGAAVGASNNIPDFLKEETARLGSGKQ